MATHSIIKKIVFTRDYHTLVCEFNPRTRRLIYVKGGERQVRDVDEFVPLMVESGWEVSIKE